MKKEKIMNIKLMSSQNLMESIGKMVSSERIAQHMTQDGLAEKAGVSVRTIRHLEGAKNPTMDVVFSVFQALDLQEIFSGFLASQKKVSPYELWKTEKEHQNHKEAA
jgi:transcriptional regulator with XRE-family HTH domain